MKLSVESINNFEIFKCIQVLKWPLFNDQMSHYSFYIFQILKVIRRYFLHVTFSVLESMDEKTERADNYFTIFEERDRLRINRVCPRDLERIVGHVGNAGCELGSDLALPLN